MNRIILPVLVLLLALTACVPASNVDPQATTPSPTAAPRGMGMGMRMGMGSGMMTRHQATIPEPYAGLSSPVAADDESVLRGEAIFTTHCASCHGDGAMGDGPAGAALDPSPAPVAHTSQMMGDDYLFWRISEGGVPFDTAMPVWKETLDEPARWDVINYVRALGKGQVTPRRGMGGAAFDPLAETQQRAETLRQAVEQKVITQDEATTFEAVHSALDTYLAANPGARGAGNGVNRQARMLAALVQAGTITQAQADTFSTVHDRLLESGLMP
jgi:mono/diheme cytochrome c family protein